jgi:hypothetical protein
MKVSPTCAEYERHSTAARKLNGVAHSLRTQDIRGLNLTQYRRAKKLLNELANEFERMAEQETAAFN